MSSTQNPTVRYIKDTVIDGYMLGDLQKLIDIPVVSNETGNCNFPIVLYIFSCMEFLGTLTSETFISGGRGATQARIWAYMELSFGEDLQEFEQYRDSFVQIFRNGLSHEFFAQNSGVSRHEENLFGTSEGGKIVLDADKFFEVFRNSCNNLKSQMDTSEELAEHISTRYRDIQQRNQERWPSFSRSSTMSSGATLPREMPPSRQPTTTTLPYEMPRTDQATTATPSLPPDDEE